MGILIILLGCVGLSVFCGMRYDRKLAHGCGIGLVSYLVMQAANTVHLGYVDPFLLVGIPIGCVIGVLVYYPVHYLIGRFRNR